MKNFKESSFGEPQEDDQGGNNPTNNGNRNNNPNNNPNNTPDDIDMPNAIPLGMFMSVMAGGKPKNESDDDNDLVHEILINYNEKFKNSSKALFRDEEVKNTMAVLLNKNKPNPLLIGHAGTGKTKIVEELARMLANNDTLVPNTLKDMTIYELPINNLMAGTELRGELEKRLKAVLDFAENPENKAIIFIDEIHTIMSNSTTMDSISQSLKPAMARGDIKLIAATTTQESTVLLKDPALNRRFSQITVTELTKEESLVIVGSFAEKLMEHHINNGDNVEIPEDLLSDVVELSEKYHAPGSHRPDNAITLLDGTVGKAIVANKAMIEEMIASNDPHLMGVASNMQTATINKLQLKATAYAMMTGNKTIRTASSEQLRKALSEIKGQNHVIDEVLNTVERLELDLFPKTQPLTIMLAGTSGVGKTEMCEIFAREYVDCKPIVLNMTEYNSETSVNKIVGSADGYIGSDSKAEKPFDALKTNPKQVILLDEFEKADVKVQRLFMQIFDKGVLKMNRGDEIDFSQSIIFMTTNAGNKDVTKSVGFGEKPQLKELTQGQIVEKLKLWFDVELMNRFSAIYQFNEISKEVYKEIIISLYEKQASVVNNAGRHSLNETLTDEEVEKIMNDTYEPALGARPAKRAVTKLIEDTIIKSL